MFDGRKDFQIKHQGYRIELGEIEHVLLSSMSQIDNACVIYNRERKEITLFYECKEAITPAAIRQKLNELLPKYMLPSVFHRVESMPRNPNGKIDRQFFLLQMENDS
jgi:acyl-coenzyme A synthetase/AMP-(fatty) acid ligase